MFYIYNISLLVVQKPLSQYNNFSSQSFNQRGTLNATHPAVSNGLTLPDKKLVEIFQPNTQHSLDEDDATEDTVNNIVSRFQKKIMNDNYAEKKAVESDQENTDASIIADLLSKKLNTSTKQTEATTFSPDLVSQQPVLENTSAMATKTAAHETNSLAWGDWGKCSTTCGIGHMTRMLQCEAEECSTAKELFQTKPCRQQTCEIGKIVIYLWDL